jgi:hypothetical protein
MQPVLRGSALLFCLVAFSHVSNAAENTLSEVSCARLAASDFTSAVGANVTITKAALAADGPDTDSLHCHILATIAPSTGVEIQLPVSGWNSRFLFTGCGGACGRLRTNQGADALARNYVVATTDMGHRLVPGRDPRWWINNQEITEAFRHRATHHAALLAKAVINAAYGRPQDYAYFRGCSTGGRQGLTAAVMYPDDFDGVIAGASGTKIVIPHNVFAYASNTRPDGSSILTVKAINLLADAAVAACDSDDGINDGVIANPRQCEFEPAAMRCDATNADSCLTDEQIVAASHLYHGARRDDGTPFYSVGYAKGSERDWIPLFIGTDSQAPRGPSVTKFSVSRLVGPDATLADFDYAKHGTSGSPLSGSIDYGPDGKRLENYRNKGGKLLLYHGWLDTVATPASSLDFYAAQAEALGADKLPDFLRLFMFPGMKHCRDGHGVNTADYLSAMESWVEGGKAPESMDAYGTLAPAFNYIAHPLDPDTVVTGRKLFPYPSASIYDGSGDPANPQNWAKR